MRLYIPTMDATLVEVDPGRGLVRFEGEGWSAPTLQERRAILHAASAAEADDDPEIAALVRFLDHLSAPPGRL
jgi:hypothetical protein